MSIQSEINRLKANINDSFAAVAEMGGTAAAGASSDNLAASILTIPTGVELNFEVIGGKTKPSNPKENAIWVNTSTAITGWAFSTEEPASPAPGMVWFRTGELFSVSFNALKEENITVYPIKCYQYVRSAFVPRDAMAYINGEWIEWHLWLYRHGDLCESITGGWDATFKQDSSWTVKQLNLNADNMSGSVTVANVNLMRCTENAIDLSGKILYMRYSAVVNTGTKVYFCLRLHATLASGTEVGSDVIKCAAGDTINNGVLSIDCSSITVPVYVMADAISNSAVSATFTVHDVWAEEA